MKKILIIEDNDDIRDNLEEIFELEAYEYESAPNGKIGIEKALQYFPDLILCDIAMPEKNGYEVFNDLKTFLSTNKIPFIFLTANAQEKEIAAGRKLGVDDYVTKPYQLELLLSTIKKLIHKI